MSDLAHVERVTSDVAREVMATVPGAVPAFAPAVRFHTMGQTGVTCSVTLRAHEFTDQFLIRHEFIKRLHARYGREGIVVPYSPVDPRALPPPPSSDARITGRERPGTPQASGSTAN